LYAVSNNQPAGAKTGMPIGQSSKGRAMPKQVRRHAAPLMPYVFRTPATAKKTGLAPHFRTGQRTPAKAMNMQPPLQAPTAIPGLHPNPYDTPDGTPTQCQPAFQQVGGCPALTHFAIGSAEPTAAHLQLLEAIAATILQHNIRFVVVTGHADATGADESNLILGRKRARNITKALKTALYRQKINSADPIFWKIETRGESEPVSKTDNGLNRRAVICLLKNVCN
jgi:outer membrane protein OmpA-like peptidoglycan-associated protein